MAVEIKLQREIKFRCKYSLKHEWHYGHFYNNCDVGVNQDIIICFNEKEFQPQEFIVDRKFLGQFTGLRDSVGKEIYEDDIITVEYGKGRVIFHAGCFMIEWIDDPEANMEWLGMYHKPHNLGRTRTDVVVIGNIHDNPELAVTKGT